jgi:hypothetical protein
MGSRRRSRSRPSLPLCSAVALGALCLTGCVADEKDQPQAKQQEGKSEPKPRCFEKGGVLAHDLTLTRECSPYVLDAGIDVINNATLTIEPGVEVRFRDGNWLEIGATGRPGRLVARGTPERPIVLTTDHPDIARPGSPEKAPTWFGVWFHSGTLPGSVLTNAIISQGGGVNGFLKPPLAQGCLTLTGVKPGALELDQLQARNCRVGALVMSESAAKVGALSFEDSPAGLVSDAQSLGSITLPVAYRGVAQNIITGGTVTSDAEWVPQDAPFFVSGTIQVGGESSPTLALGPGLALRFDKGVALEVGTRAPGGIKANGTPKAPVTLTANSADAPWRGLTLGAQTTEGSGLDSVELSNSAGEAGISVLSAKGRVSIKGSSFSNNGTDVLVGCGAKPTLVGDRYRSAKGVVQKAPCP